MKKYLLIAPVVALALTTGCTTASSGDLPTVTTASATAPSAAQKATAVAKKRKAKAKAATKARAAKAAAKRRAAKPKPKSVYYANCTAVRAAGADPIRTGDAGYSRTLDRDGDGVACE